MKASNGSAFLPLLAVLELLGLKISLFPIHVGETDMATNVGLLHLVIHLVSEEEVSLGVARSLSVPITFPVVRKMLAQGRPTSVTFACRSSLAQSQLRRRRSGCSIPGSFYTAGVAP